MSKRLEIERQMKAYANNNRLHILAYLKRRPSATVGEISEVLGISEASTSAHLRLLKNADIVLAIRRGMYTSYRLPLKKDPLLRLVLKAL